MGYALFKPGDPVPSYLWFPGDDKIIHFILFMGAGVLTLLVFTYEYPLSFALRVSITLFVLVSAAFVSEWIQAYIPHRSSDYSDTAYDVAGALASVFFHIATEKRFNRSSNKV